jgi:hypothetical protein
VGAWRSHFGDAPPAEVLAAFARLAPTMGDCIQLTPAGQWMTFEVDVTWHLAQDGRITDAKATGPTTARTASCSAGSSEPRSPYT